MKNKYLEFYKINFGAGVYCTKSWGLVSYNAGAECRQVEVDELKQRITMLEIDVHIRDKMINDALKEIKSGITGKHHVSCIAKILKGESSE